MPIKSRIKARTLQEWMERTGTTNKRLCRLVQEQTGHTISLSMMSYMLRRSKPISVVNSIALSAVTGIDSKVLRAWSLSARPDKVSGEGSNCAA